MPRHHNTFVLLNEQWKETEIS